MKNRIKLCLQVAWLTTMFVVMLMGFNLCAATDQACSDAGGRMVLTMAVLSFPAGFFSVVVTLLFLDVPGDQLNQFVLFWWLMAGAGYVQWFVLVPKLFAKAEFTKLNLEQEIKLNNKESLTEIAAPRPRKTKRINRIPAYDKLGRTPLERAMQSSPTNASA